LIYYNAKKHGPKFEQWCFLCDVFETKLRENENI
jgi:hypothetical protein